MIYLLFLHFASYNVTMLATIEETYAIAEMIIKVKEPIEKEYSLIKKDQLCSDFISYIIL